MRSTRELVKELQTAPRQWMDSAIVVAFENRFEFVSEDHPDPVRRLKYLEEQGGLAIGLAGVKPTANTNGKFFAQVYQEFEHEAWAHRYMDTLRGIVGQHSNLPM